jgi:hypothetical protein
MGEIGKEKLTRGEALFKGAIAVGAFYGIGAVGPYVSRGLAAADNDADVLDFLLSFEYLQASIYTRGISEVNYRGEKIPLDKGQTELVETLLEEEGQHVSALRSMIEKLGGKPSDKGGYAFSYRDVELFLEIAAELETFSLAAYNGAIPSLQSKEARELAFSIVQVDGRHAAAVLVQVKGDPAPEAFDEGDSEVNLINAVVKYTGVYPE